MKTEFISSFIQALSKVASSTRSESGNMIYEFSVEEVDKSRIYLYEKYCDREAYVFHTQQDYLNVFKAEIVGFLEEAPEVIRGNLHI